MVVRTERRSGLGRAERAGALGGAVSVGGYMAGRHDGSRSGILSSGQYRQANIVIDARNAGRRTVWMGGYTDGGSNK